MVPVCSGAVADVWFCWVYAGICFSDFVALPRPPPARFDARACCFFEQNGSSLVSCVFANDVKEYLVVGTAYVREEVRLRSMRHVDAVAAHNDDLLLSRVGPFC